MDAAFLQERITKTKALIVAYEDAVLALTEGGQASYMIDTGQTRQSVTRHDLAGMNATIDRLYNRLETLEARANGGGVQVRPLW